MHLIIGGLSKSAQLLAAVMTYVERNIAVLSDSEYPLIAILPFLTSNAHLAAAVRAAYPPVDRRFFEKLTENDALFDTRKEGKGQRGFLKESFNLPDEMIPYTVVLGGTTETWSVLEANGYRPFVTVFDNAPDELQQSAHLVLSSKKMAGTADTFVTWLSITRILASFQTAEQAQAYLAEIKPTLTSQLSTEEELVGVLGLFDKAYRHFYGPDYSIVSGDKEAV